MKAVLKEGKRCVIYVNDGLVGGALVQDLLCSVGQSHLVLVIKHPLSSAVAVAMLLKAGIPPENIQSIPPLGWKKKPELSGLLVWLTTYAKNHGLVRPINTGYGLFLPIKDSHPQYLDVCDAVSSMGKLLKIPALRIVYMREGIGMEGELLCLDPAWVCEYFFRHFPECYPISLGIAGSDQYAIAYTNQIGGAGMAFQPGVSEALANVLQAIGREPPVPVTAVDWASPIARRPTDELARSNLQKALKEGKGCVVCVNHDLVPQGSIAFKLLNRLRFAISSPGRLKHRVFVMHNGLDWTNIVGFLLTSGIFPEHIQPIILPDKEPAIFFEVVLPRLKEFATEYGLPAPVNAGHCVFFPFGQSPDYSAIAAAFRFMETSKERAFAQTLQWEAKVQWSPWIVGMEENGPYPDPALRNAYLFGHFPECYPVSLGTENNDRFASAHTNANGGLGITFQDPASIEVERILRMLLNEPERV